MIWLSGVAQGSIPVLFLSYIIVGKAFCRIQPLNKLTTRRSATRCKLVKRLFPAKRFPHSNIREKRHQYRALRDSAQPYHRGLSGHFFPIRRKSHCLHSFNENNYLKKCIPFTPKLIEIEIENRVFREINCDFLFRQNRTALPDNRAIAKQCVHTTGYLHSCTQKHANVDRVELYSVCYKMIYGYIYL